MSFQFDRTCETAIKVTGASSNLQSEIDFFLRVSRLRGK